MYFPSIQEFKNLNFPQLQFPGFPNAHVYTEITKFSKLCMFCYPADPTEDQTHPSRNQKAKTAANNSVEVK
jgi:hypothetical protein